MNCHRYYLGSGVWGLFVEGISSPVCTSGDGARLDDMIDRLQRPGLAGESDAEQLQREADHSPALAWRLNR